MEHWSSPDGCHPDCPECATEETMEINDTLLTALKEIHKLWCCPEPKRLKDWSARCDVMADYARKAIAKAEGEKHGN